MVSVAWIDVNCGYGRSSWLTETFVPVSPEGNSPTNGFGTCVDSRLFLASSRTGDVERYCPGTAFSCCVTGRFTPCAPT